MFANLLLQEMGLERIKYMYMFLTGHGHRVINGDKMEKEKNCRRWMLDYLGKTRVAAESTLTPTSSSPGLEPALIGTIFQPLST